MRNRYWKEMILLLSVLLFIVFFLEAGLQIAFRLKNGHWLWTDTAFRVGYTQPIKDRRQYCLRAGYADERKGIKINSLGFRGEIVSPGDEYIGVAIGDSVPFGAAVSDSEAYPFVLDDLMK